MNLKKIFLRTAIFLFSVNLFAYSGIMSGQKNLKINKTKYFDIIYAEGSENSAKTIFENCDEIYKELSAKFELQNKFRLPVVISPAQDDFNAYFSSAPFNHIVIFDTVCTKDLAVFSDEILNTFKHELVHAITYNLRNNFWFGVDKIFGDFWNPGLLTIPMAWAEGATVSLESENGEGRLNDEYALQMVKQSKIEGNFPKYSEIQGAMDVFPSGKASYMFGGSFNAWLQKKYGMQKYADFWYRCVNLKNFTYFGCFKKVYGISIKKAWNQFYKELEVPEIPAEPEKIKGIEKVLFKNPNSVYSSMTSSDGKFFYYDEYKQTINFVQSGKSEKAKVLCTEPNVLQLSASKDGRFLVETYSSENYLVPKNKIKIRDLQKNYVFSVPEKSLRDGTIVFADGNYFLCAVKTFSAFSSLQIYKLDLKKEKIFAAELIFEQKFLQNQQIFSLEGNLKGSLFYVLKNGLEYSINELDVLTKKTKIYNAPQTDFIFRDLNYFSEKKENNAENRNFIIFSYARKNSMPKFGILNLDSAEFSFCKQDVSGGIYNPVVFSAKKAAYIAKFYRYSKIYYADFSQFDFDNFQVKIEECDFENFFRQNSGQIQGEGEKNSYFEKSSKKFSAFGYNFSGPHGTFVPFSFFQSYANKNLSSLKSVWLPFGISYVSSTPWTNPLWYISGGYNFLTNSEGLKFYITNSVNSLSEIFLYSFSAQVEFDDKGYKQSYGNLNLISKIPLFGANYIKFSDSGTILEGRQSETSISAEEKPEYLFDYFKILKTTEKEYLYLNNSGKISFGNIHKSGFGYYDYSGIQISSAIENSFLALSENLDYYKTFDNISFDLLIKNSFLRPITLQAVLFPNDSYIAAAMANVVLYNWEIQKSTDFLPLLYLNRITLSSYYVGKCAYNIDSWALFEANKYFEKIKSGDFSYEDELALSCSFGFTPNIGGFARSSFLIDISCSAKYRFFPAENQKEFQLSAGIGTNFSL